MAIRERRRAARTLQRFLVRFEDAGEMRMAFTENVSGAGLFLKTRYPPPPGADVRMLVRTAHGSRAVRGTVVWARLNLAAPAEPGQGSGAGIRLSQPGVSLPGV